MATVKELTYRLTVLAEQLPDLRERAEQARRADAQARQAVARNENDTREVLRQLRELCDPDSRGTAMVTLTVPAGDQR